MDTFPVQYSTLSSIALKDYIEKIYGLKNLRCRLLTKNVSDTYLLENDGHKYVFKIFRTGYRPLSEIEGEVELLNILKDNHIPVSYPIPDLIGGQIQQIHAAEGARYGILYSFAAGKVALIPDEEQLYIIGRNIALMHNITSNCKLKHERPVYNIHTTLDRPLQLIAKRFTEFPDEYEYLKDLAESVRNKLDQLPTSGFSYGYCHYDLLPKNFHFDEDNDITFFDFDWAGKGFLVNDLMTFYVQLFFLVHYQLLTQEVADEYFGIVIQSYREQRHLSAEELSAIPYLGVMFFIYGFGFYEENFDDFSIAFLTPKFIRERVELIKKLAAWFDMS